MNEEVRLQRHLSLFRACAGWTTQMLAEQLGVSRQTVSAWENYNELDHKKGVKLSRIHYLAIRQLLESAYRSDQSGEKEKERHILETMLEVIVDNPGNKYGPKDVDAVLDEAKLLAPSIREQPEKRKNISKAWKVLLIGGAAVSAVLLAYLGFKEEERG